MRARRKYSPYGPLRITAVVGSLKGLTALGSYPSSLCMPAVERCKAGRRMGCAVSTPESGPNTTVSLTHALLTGIARATTEIERWAGILTSGHFGCV